MAEELEDAPWIKQEATSELPDAPWATTEQKPLSWSDVPGQAVRNVGPSAIEFGKSIIAPVSDVAEYGARGIDWAAQKLGATPREPQPTPTVENFANIGKGILEKTGMKESAGNEQYADAVGKFFMDRYGSAEGIKRTLATDPVGAAADISTVLSGGSALAARAPGVVGKVGRVAGTIGELTNPLTPVSRGVGAVAGAAGKAATGIIGGLGTGTGGEAIRVAAKAGYEGGAAAKAFRDNIRGASTMEETVSAAREGITNLRKERGAAYTSGMVPVANDATILNFNEIDAALGNAVKVYKGQSISPSVEAVRNKMWDAVDKWKNLPASEFHTAEGFDALKQLLYDISKEAEYGTPARLTADKIYNATKDTIQKQVPEYAKVMEGYEKASKQIKEIERSLVGKPSAAIETSLRKLQSVLRNNVSTAYGGRKELADYLIKAGAPHLMERLAGQALQPGLPRGMTRFVAQIGAEVAGLLGITAGGLGLPAMAGAAATLPFMSPRLVGEAAYYAGRTASPLKQLGRLPLPPRSAVLPAYQTSRLLQSHVMPLPEAKKEPSPDFIDFLKGGLRKSGGRVLRRAEGGFLPDMPFDFIASDQSVLPIVPVARPADQPSTFTPPEPAPAPVRQAPVFQSVMPQQTAPTGSYRSIDLGFATGGRALGGLRRR